MFCCVRNPASSKALEIVARACSPRVELGDGDVVFDVGGLAHAVGPPGVIASEVEKLLRVHGLKPTIAIAGTKVAARLLAAANRTPVIITAGEEAAALSHLPLSVFHALGSVALGLGPNATFVGACLTSFLRWGLHTLGDLARLSEADVRTRLGDVGARLHQAARGLDAAPLVPLGEPVCFLERLDLEWPIEGLEPLSFVLSRLCESLSETLERADRGAVSVTTRLRLVTRATHERVLTLPAPMRDARVLRSLILLDLESHGPGAAIDIVEVVLGVTPGRIVQGSLLTRALPSPEALTTLVARLGALMGESRVGAPVLLDTHDERGVAIAEFAPHEQGRRHKAQGISEERTDAIQLLGNSGWPAEARSTLVPSALCLLPCLRRYRLPLVVSMTVDRGAPIQMRSTSRTTAGGPVVASAGPWRSSGRWWHIQWDQDHWDIELRDGVYRIARDRATGRWEIEGAID